MWKKMCLSVRQKNLNRRCSLLVTVVWCCTVLLTGCAGTGTSGGGASAWISAPQDVRLTAVEQKAFDSTGQLDRGLSARGKAAVKKEYARYVHMKRANINVITQRAAKYLPHARIIFRSYGLPEELACLAIVESGYNPQAASRAGAAGAWQFMPKTGDAYGLVRDNWLDERLDPYKSADAAARYLKKLYGRFGNWYMAVAAYNAGEGKLMRAQKQTGQREFFALAERNHTLSSEKRLREETLAYVPRLLAVTKIVRNLDLLGFAPIASEREEKMVPISVAPGTDLKALCKITSMSWSDFRAYNAAHKRQITCTSRQTTVYVPKKCKQMVAEYLRTAHPVSDSRLYTASRNDTWQSISSRMGVDMSILLAANQGVRLQTGTKVVIPGRARTLNNARAAVQATPQTVSVIQPANGGIHATYIVQAGDNLWSIARKYNVKLQDLMRWNKEYGDALRPGDKVIVRM